MSGWLGAGWVGGRATQLPVQLAHTSTALACFASKALCDSHGDVLPACSYLTKRYDDLVRQVPLMAVHSAGRSSVPSDIYTPPPLRSGGQGWHPEW